MGKIEGKSLERYFSHLKALEEFQKLFAYDEPNDRAIVIVGGAFLDTLLENILIEFFPDGEKDVEELLEPSQALGTFASKIKLIYCLGFLEKVVKEDLKLIGKIRNRFAHNISASFNDSQVISWTKQLKWHKIYFMDNEPPSDATIRDIYQVEVNTLISNLNGIISSARAEKRKVQNNF